ncbi:hypothetical protein L484_016556 [Morus notabilis]|uniref:HAUS augmin-like complex subunit 6 N-terminal domain-containing protein n=1 Tax=Morus notabilis TaxID=981085 RepID=W9QV41_9ROSA|nr:hypothetical protein L484_016556 [Morus notabilis]
MNEINQKNDRRDYIHSKHSHNKVARIALERRRFLKNAETAVQQQAMWENLAHEMTAEFRGLCAEEAYLQQELEKLHDLRNKVKVEGEHWDDLVSSSSQNSHLLSKATRLWESILSRKTMDQVLRFSMQMPQLSSPVITLHHIWKIKNKLMDHISNIHEYSANIHEYS